MTTVWCSQLTIRAVFVLFDFAGTAEVCRRRKAEGFKMYVLKTEEKVKRETQCSRESCRRGKQQQNEGKGGMVR